MKWTFGMVSKMSGDKTLPAFRPHHFSEGEAIRWVNSKQTSGVNWERRLWWVKDWL